MAILFITLYYIGGYVDRRKTPNISYHVTRPLPFTPNSDLEYYTQPEIDNIANIADRTPYSTNTVDSDYVNINATSLPNSASRIKRREPPKKPIRFKNTVISDNVLNFVVNDFNNEVTDSGTNVNSPNNLANGELNNYDIMTISPNSSINGKNCDITHSQTGA